ncbi:MAG: sporulation protein YabP [Anaerovorax sp.]|nr:sporulation protein YabP [Anaerovorax sp.]
MDDIKGKRSHSIYMENRERMVVTGVKDVANFNEDTVLLDIDQGGMQLKGNHLHIQSLDLEEGKVVVNGFFHSMAYTEKKEKQDKNWLERMLK